MKGEEKNSIRFVLEVSKSLSEIQDLKVARNVHQGSVYAASSGCGCEDQICKCKLTWQHACFGK